MNAGWMARCVLTGYLGSKQACWVAGMHDGLLYGMLACWLSGYYACMLAG